MADLLTEVKDRVLYLTLNRPDKLNAMSAEMMGGLVDNLSRAATNPEIGAVVLTGAGRGFCSGGDIGGMRERNESGNSGATTTIEDRVAGLRRGEEASLMLHEMAKVTIAAVNGPAAGAGCPDSRERHLPDHPAASPDDPGSTPCVGTADLAPSQQCPAGAGLVVVAALPPQPCLLLPYQASARSRLNPPGMDSLHSLYSPWILPVVPG